MTQTAGRIERSTLSDKIKSQVRDEAEGCAYCGDVLVPLQVEHFVPLSRGGTNEIDNLRAACVSCNSQKRAMLFHEWRLFRQTHGMPWPPLAGYATDPVHYGDTCRECQGLYFDLAYAELGIVSGFNFICKAEELRHKPKRDGSAFGGYTGYYRCPMGHRWKCWYTYSGWYYTDCPCAYCQTRRDDAGDETYTYLRYSDKDSVLQNFLRNAGLLR